jgi:SAM-dependent methyltransferase
MSDGFDFSRNAAVYDRRHGAFLGEADAEKLIRLANLRAASRVLDVGTGTGRVAIPLARHCLVMGLDLSHAMLNALATKNGTTAVRVAVGSATALPFHDHIFDAVIFARILYLLPKWREAIASAIRVLKPSGAILHEWGNGTGDEPWAQIRDKARELFEAADVREPFHPGVRTEAEVTAYLGQLGFAVVAETIFEPDARMALGEFLDRIVIGECSYTWKLPRDVQQQCVPKLVQWARARFDMASIVTSPVVWKVWRNQEM